jgi:hypothetical protein
MHLQRFLGVECRPAQLTDEVALCGKVTLLVSQQVVSFAASKAAVLARVWTCRLVLLQVTLQRLAPITMQHISSECISILDNLWLKQMQHINSECISVLDNNLWLKQMQHISSECISILDNNLWLKQTSK